MTVMESHGSTHEQAGCDDSPFTSPTPPPAQGRPLIVAIIGDRLWQDGEAIEREMRKLPSGSCVVTTKNSGVARIARDMAGSMGLKTKAYYADWQTHGSDANVIRDALLLKRERPHLVIAFHTNVAGSQETKAMLELAQRNSFPTLLFVK